MNINIAILEDNRQDYETLRDNLLNWGTLSGNIINISWFISAKQIYEKFNIESFDILFCDIELKTSNCTTGMEICVNLRKNGYSGEIIFLTAFSEYVFEGYNVNAFNYLLKPIEVEKLCVCMNHYSSLHTYDYYYYHKGNDVIKIPYNDIVYFLKENHYVIIQLSNTLYAERITLSEIEKRLPTFFQRCHKSCIINMLHVHSIIGNILYLSNNKTQTIGRNYLDKIRKYLIDLSQK